MGKTKIKTIDDSVQEVSTKESKETKIEKNEASSTSTTSIPSKKSKVSKRAQKKAAEKHKIRSKKYQEAREKVEKNKKYPVQEAISLAQQTSYTKFSGSLEAHINTAAKNLRGSVSLPYLAGRKLTILAFGDEKSSADIIGSDETITEIEKGKINFDVIVTTPAWMPKLAKVAKVLGPRGLMPSPKNDTVSDNLEKTVAELRGGKTEYKTESNGQVIHLAIGKVDQATEEVASNIKILYNSIGRSKIKALTLSSSMGPGVKVDLSSI